MDGANYWCFALHRVARLTKAQVQMGLHAYVLEVSGLPENYLCINL